MLRRCSEDSQTSATDYNPSRRSLQFPWCPAQSQPATAYSGSPEWRSGWEGTLRHSDRAVVGVAVVWVITDRLNRWDGHRDQR